MRIRTIKPDFWSDEMVASWPIVGRLSYIGLWNEADDEGRLRASVPYLKARLFPYDADIEMESVLAPIIASGRLVVYVVDGQTFGWLPKFVEHQVINRPSPSKLPPPPNEGSRKAHGKLSDRSRIAHPGREGKGREGKGTGSGECGLTEGSVSGDLFAEFWATYPRKTNKADAAKAWAKLVNGQREKAVAGAAVMADAWRGQPEERIRFVPYPSTWLNAKSWENDPEEVRRQARPAPGKPHGFDHRVGAHDQPFVPDPEFADAFEAARRRS